MGDVFDFDVMKGLVAQHEEDHEIVQVNAGHLGGLDCY